jgi:DNA-binding LacI/PurR family transcriptional regulator
MTSIKDVARAAGVSSATVSRVLSDKPYVTDSVRQRVLQAAREIGYHPDQTARRLRMHSTSLVIGLIVTDIRNPYIGAMVRGVEDSAYSQNMNILLCNTDRQPERQQFYLERMRSERAAGLIIIPTSAPPDGALVERIRRAGIAVVLIDSPLAGYDFDQIAVDDRGGAREATAHLLARGYTRIAIIAGRQSLHTGRNRLAGYADAIKQAGIAPDSALIQYGDYSRESGYAAMRALLDLPTPPQAVFACNESMTSGALKALNERRIAIPDQIALIGFDDVPWAEDLRPALTTVAQPTYDIGREAMRLLLRRLKEPDAPILSVSLPTQLIVRESCGALSKGEPLGRPYSDSSLDSKP